MPLPPVPTAKPDDPGHQNFSGTEDIPLDVTCPEIIIAAKPSAVTALLIYNFNSHLLIFVALATPLLQPDYERAQGKCETCWQT